MPAYIVRLKKKDDPVWKKWGVDALRLREGYIVIADNKCMARMKSISLSDSKIKVEGEHLGMDIHPLMNSDFSECCEI